MLRGHATAKADNKGRIKLPAEFQSFFLDLCGPSRRVFITSHDGRMILVYPLPVWEEHEKKLATLPSTAPALQTYLRAVSYWGKEATVDAAGRILLHPLLRDAARINGVVSVFGRQRTLEICDHELFRGQPPTVSTDDLAHLAEYGL
jgi:MraZ protein